MISSAPLLGPFRPHYPVVTSGLLLRSVDPVGDLDAMHAYYSRADVCRYIPPEPRTCWGTEIDFAIPARERRAQSH